jgi:predicted nicotinamide N-methyase
LSEERPPGSQQSVGLNTDSFPVFVETNTEILSPPLVPEIQLRLATEITPIWQATEAQMAEANLPPPFWAFCWPGGQALARYILDTPEIVQGKRVLEFAAGGAVSGIAAAIAGATEVIANDIDPIAIAAAGMNAALNDVKLTPSTENYLDRDTASGCDVILAGDIFYEQSPAVEIEAFLRREASGGALVLIGDPGRKYLPIKNLQEVMRYEVPTSLELEDREIRDGVVWRVM